jgi:hypothetical protein
MAFRESFKSRPAYSPRGEIRPLFVNFSPYSANMGRSPLVSIMFPTVKDKITTVNRLCEDISSTNPAQSQKSPRFLPALELEKIVKLETKARNFRSISHTYDSQSGIKT